MVAGKMVANAQSAISQIHSALESKEWETAAKAVHRARAAPEAIITGKLALQMVPSSDVPESPAEYIEQVSEQLHGLFKREFEHAASTRDQHKISRFFKLFPLIGREASGLQTYTSFVATIITTRVRAVMAESGIARRENSLALNNRRIPHVLRPCFSNAPGEYCTYTGPAFAGGPALLWPRKHCNNS